jgi:hypothetical protein
VTLLVAAGDRQWRCVPTPCPGLEAALVPVWKAVPKERVPDAINGVKLNRDPAFLFVSTRPQDNVRNEVSFVLGFPAKEGVDAQVVIGKTSFPVRTKTDASWLKNPKDDGALVELMKKSQSLSFKATSRRGNALTDNYVLSGFTQALDRARKECP